jgi:uncharacterized protein (DUF952 family)
VRLQHLALAADWAAATAAGEYRVSTRGATLAEHGYIHLSFPHQLAGVAQARYRDAGELVVLEIDPARLTARVVVEPGAPEPGAELFPHLYGPLPVAAVTSVRAARVDGEGRLQIDDGAA